MNLHAVVNPVIQAINPNVPMALSVSTGNRQNPDGSRTPLYQTVMVSAQVQALSGKDLRMLEGLNIQGSLRAIYFYGEVDAIVRSLVKGGDTLTDSSNNVWLVTQVIEPWADWCKVAVTLQNGS